MKNFNFNPDRKIREPPHKGEPGYTEMYPVELSPEVLSGEKQLVFTLPKHIDYPPEFMLYELKFIKDLLKSAGSYDFASYAQLKTMLELSIPRALTDNGQCPNCGSTEVQDAYVYTDCNMEDEWVNEVGYRLADRCHECDQTLKEDFK